MIQNFWWQKLTGQSMPPTWPPHPGSYWQVTTGETAPSDTMRYVRVDPDDIERIAQRAAEILRENKS